MIRILDKLWFRLLCVLYRSATRCGQAHCRREQVRNLQLHLGSQSKHLN